MEAMLEQQRCIEDWPLATSCLASCRGLKHGTGVDVNGTTKSGCSGSDALLIAREDPLDSVVDCPENTQ